MAGAVFLEILITGPERRAGKSGKPQRHVVQNQGDLSHAQLSQDVGSHTRKTDHRSLRR
jgi:hypothetical protein